MNDDEPKTVVLLGVPFHDMTMEETLDEIDRVIAARTPRYFATANLDFATQASHDVELQRILVDAHRVLCDGTPLVWASRWLDASLRERVAGSDLLPKLAERAAARGYRVFFLGSNDAVLAEAKRRLETRFPGLKICGTYAPPYATFLELNNAEMVSRISAAQPDILLVAFGAPKQEKWIYMHYRELGVPLSIGIGASLDFIAEKVSRAPVWMRKAGVEWIHRLLQEPRRLFRRYFFDLIFFVLTLRRQKKLMRKSASSEQTASSESGLTRDFVRYTWAGRADAAAVHSGAVAEPSPAEGRVDVLLNVAAVSFIDSTGLGLIIKGLKKCKQAGGELVLLQPSEPVRTLLQAMKLDRLLRSAGTFEEAEEMVQKREPEASIVVSENDRLVLQPAGDLTAATSREFAALMQERWSQNSGARQLQLDLGRLNFIDSSGLGCLIRARKLADARRGAALIITGANGNVRNVIELARLSELLGVK